MRSWIVAASLLCLLLAAGCEERTALDRPVAYDKEIDGPSPISVTYDPDLLADQTKIAARVRTALVASELPPVTETPPASPPASPPDAGTPAGTSDANAAD
jgi:hypothetical protein